MCKEFWKLLFNSKTPVQNTEKTEVTEMDKRDLYEYVDGRIDIVKEEIEMLRHEIEGRLADCVTREELEKVYFDAMEKAIYETVMNAVVDYHSFTILTIQRMLEEKEEKYNNLFKHTEELLKRVNCDSDADTGAKCGHDCWCGCKCGDKCTCSCHDKEEKEPEAPKGYQPRFLGEVSSDCELSELPWTYTDLAYGDWCRVVKDFEAAWQEGEPDDIGGARYAELKKGDILIACGQDIGGCATNIEDSYFQYWQVLRPEDTVRKG